MHGSAALVPAMYDTRKPRRRHTSLFRGKLQPLLVGKRAQRLRRGSEIQHPIAKPRRAHHSSSSSEFSSSSDGGMPARETLTRTPTVSLHSLLALAVAARTAGGRYLPTPTSAPPSLPAQSRLNGYLRHLLHPSRADSYGFRKSHANGDASATQKLASRRDTPRSGSPGGETLGGIDDRRP